VATPQQAREMLAFGVRDEYQGSPSKLSVASNDRARTRE
jgi:hypothetical protein